MLKKGKQNGKGIVLYSKEHTYIAEWKEGEKKGKGIQILVNGDVRFGEIRDGNFYYRKNN
jgi:hypothetical protein